MEIAPSLIGVSRNGRTPRWTAMTINGRAEFGQGSPIVVTNPANEDVLVELAGATDEQLDRAVTAAAAAFGAEWSGLNPSTRASHILALADALDARLDELVELIVQDVGTPISLCKTLQVRTPILHLREYARLAARDRTVYLGPHFDPVPSDSLVMMRPAGVVAAITPYNYPLSLAIAKVGAALAAGCTAVLMPSPQAPLAALALGDASVEAGLPAGVLNVVVGGVDVTSRLTEAPAVACVTFTGSVPVGKSVMRQASGHLAGMVLELGGKSPCIIMPGTPLDGFVESLHARYARNAGQGCQSPTRLLVHEAQYEEFCARSVEALSAIVVGDPWANDTIVGPLISEAHRDRVEKYVTEACEQGATIIAGGGRPPGLDRGWFMNPTLLGGLDNEFRVCQEELFGPVASVLSYASLDEAVSIANDVEFGLAAYVYSGSLEEALDLAGRLRTGAVYINGGGGFRADAPLGGTKASGVGREVGEWGIREFLEPQHLQWSL
jgi:acyl-CoA reductase-like NAD-dependent aldehyde dehydrogenase